MNAKILDESSEKEENGIIVSSNENWNRFIFNDMSIEFDDEPVLVTADVQFSQDLGMSKLSLKLLDHKFGNFFYNPDIQVIAASVGFSYEMAGGKSNFGIHIRSWFLKGKKWYALTRSPIIHSKDYHQHKNYKIASQYARSAIVRLSKAKSKENFTNMMLEIRKNCRKWVDM